MKCRVFYAEDVPHYATEAIAADSDEEALAAAKARHNGGLKFGDPDWENPIPRRT